MRMARSPAELGCNRYAALRLKTALERASDKHTFQRVQAVWLVAQGRAINEVAIGAGVRGQAVYNRITHSLASHHVPALTDSPRSGRPRAATSIPAARILGELRRDPLRRGYRTTVWTVPLLAHHLSRLYPCSLSPYTLRRQMQESGLRCQRPRYFYEEQEPHRAQQKGPLSAG
jgi:transposase